MGEFSSDMQGLGLGGKRNFGSECSGKCSDGGFATCEADSGRGISWLVHLFFPSFFFIQK